MTAAAHLDTLADRFPDGRTRLAEAVEVLDPLRATGTALAAGAPEAPGGPGGPGGPGAPGLADDVRQRLQVVGTLLGGIGGQSQHIPAARHDQPGCVFLAQVVTVRLDIGRKRPEHGRGVAVHVRERVDGGLLARGT